MKDIINKHKVLISVGVVLFLLANMFIGKYNKFVKLDEWVNLAWSQVENQYQRRTDLIPQLVTVAKQYASEERETFTDVIEARSAATSVTVNADNLEWLQQFAAKQGELTQALSKLMLLREAYPDLKSAPLFQDLQVQLEWTENRIATQRGRFNETAAAFNSLIRQFPNNLFGSFFGFWVKPLFESQQWADTAPSVGDIFDSREK